MTFLTQNELGKYGSTMCLLEDMPWEFIVFNKSSVKMNFPGVRNHVKSIVNVVALKYIYKENKHYRTLGLIYHKMYKSE
jgi:hypothetical protein